MGDYCSLRFEAHVHPWVETMLEEMNTLVCGDHEQRWMPWFHIAEVEYRLNLGPFGYNSRQYNIPWMVSSAMSDLREYDFEDVGTDSLGFVAPSLPSDGVWDCLCCSKDKAMVLQFVDHVLPQLISKPCRVLTWYELDSEPTIRTIQPKESA